MIARGVCLLLAAVSLPVLAADIPGPETPGEASRIPEPSDVVLFAAGVIGLIIGRHGSRSRRRPDD